ncbi:MAG: hypothetical protein H6708_16980 [Kofleriaceae bacterium]|nr:hypothetical protein [Kofleriaceae bacterium]
MRPAAHAPLLALRLAVGLAAAVAATAAPAAAQLAPPAPPPVATTPPPPPSVVTTPPPVEPAPGALATVPAPPTRPPPAWTPAAQQAAEDDVMPDMPPARHHPGPSGFWTGYKPAKGGAYRWRLLGIAIAVLGVTVLLLRRALMRASRRAA